jgi:shikimate kinase
MLDMQVEDDEHFAVYRLTRRGATAARRMAAGEGMTDRAEIGCPRSVVLVGMMGAGKTSVGKRLAQALDLPFVDADDEIVRAAGCSIEEIFRTYGEAAFRDGERRVISRILEDGPLVLATGGGAFMNPETRAAIANNGISIWLDADLDVLYRRTRRRKVRPLLQNDDPRGTLERLMAQRNPIYATADLTIETAHERPDATVARIVELLKSQGIQRGAA